MSEYYVHVGDLAIIRDPESPEIAKCYDADGEYIYTFPSFWTDEQIRDAVVFANSIYAEGIRRGKEEKAQEIRSVIGCQN